MHINNYDKDTIIKMPPAPGLKSAKGVKKNKFIYRTISNISRKNFILLLIIFQNFSVMSG